MKKTADPRCLSYLKRWGNHGEGKEDVDMYNENDEDEVPGKLKPKLGSGWDGVWRMRMEQR